MPRHISIRSRHISIRSRSMARVLTQTANHTGGANSTFEVGAEEPPRPYKLIHTQDRKRWLPTVHVALCLCSYEWHITAWKSRYTITSDVYMLLQTHNYTLRTTKLLGGGGVYWFHSVRSSVRPSRVRPASHVRSVAPKVLVESISYLYILSSNFRRCVVYKGSCKISIFGIFFLICNFFLFWLGIWCESLVWVINHGAAGVSQNAGVLFVLVMSLSHNYV